MRLKPTASNPVIVCAVRHVYAGIFSAQWDDVLNYPRKLGGLFRRIDGKWTSGEAHPTGLYSSPLRDAPLAVASALETFSQTV